MSQSAWYWATHPQKRVSFYDVGDDNVIQCIAMIKHFGADVFMNPEYKRIDSYVCTYRVFVLT